MIEAKLYKLFNKIQNYHWGTANFWEMIQKDIDLTNYLSRLISESSDFELK